MVKNSLWYWGTFAFLLWVGIWAVYSNVRRYRYSGFRFYLIAGLIIGAPFLFWALVFYYSPNAVILPLLVVTVVSRLGAEWAMDQEEEAGRSEPDKWKAWQARVSAQNIIGRLFF